MSQSGYNSLALHEILLSIANSLNEAQHTLRSMPAYDEYGRPNTLYHLPYLDFNLEVVSSFESTESTIPEDTVKRVTSDSFLRKESFAQLPSVNAIRFIPYRSTESSSKNTGSITSSISGRFVAVMPNEGQRQVLMTYSTEVAGQTDLHIDYTITLRLVYPDNTPVSGQRIELNFDEMTSSAINSTLQVTAPILLNSNDGLTNTEGEFSSTLRFDKDDYSTGATFVFVANSGTQFLSIAISKD